MCAAVGCCRGSGRRGSGRRGTARAAVGRAAEGWVAEGWVAPLRDAQPWAVLPWAVVLPWNAPLWVAPLCGTRCSVGRAAMCVARNLWLLPLPAASAVAVIADALSVCETAHALCYLCAILSAIFAIFEDSPR